MNIILLSGGSGKRLWPLSNDVRAKQFLKVFKKVDGSKESMIQRTYRLIREADDDANVIVATSDSQIPMIKNQINSDCMLSIEPERRDTFPAIALAALTLIERKNLLDEDTIAVCPVDPLVDGDFYKLLHQVSIEAEISDFNLSLIGISPTYPSEKYGYIIPEIETNRSPVKKCKEKPNEDMAKALISQGGLWNSGVFIFKVKYITDIINKLCGFQTSTELACHYSELDKISFDYAVVEKEKSIEVFRYSGSWKDLGTWNTLTEAMNELTSGNVTLDFCENTHVINELEIPMVVLGAKDMAIAATPDGILVSDKLCSVKLKDYAPELRPMYEKREWGEYTVLGYQEIDGNKVLTKHLSLLEGEHLSYQSHEKRSEQWTIVSGEGRLIIDDVERKVKRGDSVYIERNMKHSIKADSNLHIIEVQLGEDLMEDDIVRYEWNWK